MQGQGGPISVYNEGVLRQPLHAVSLPFNVPQSLGLLEFGVDEARLWLLLDRQENGFVLQSFMHSSRERAILFHFLWLIVWVDLPMFGWTHRMEKISGWI